MTRFKAVLCDVDGTMVLSEARNRAVIENLIIGNGGAVTEADWTRIAGKAESAVWDDMKGRYPDLRITRDDFIRACHDKCISGEFNVAARPGMAETLAYYRQQGLAVAGVTNAPRDVALHSLTTTGLAGALQFLLSATEIRAAGRALKPAADPYLMAAAMLGVAPHECLVLEDSGTGVAAAKAAGMTVLQFCDQGSPPSPQADYHVRCPALFGDLARLIATVPQL